MDYDRPMNRWSVAAALVVVATVAWLVFVDAPGDCPTAGLNECGGFQVSPFFVGFAGLLLAAILGFLSVIRSK
jgi:hypothetical protein